MQIMSERTLDEGDRCGALHNLENLSQFVVGQLGQSLDGRIATRTGESKYINRQEGLRHLHQLRALVDAVIVGVGTVNEDNPQLTVRHCEGNSPKRIIIDPKGRVFTDAALFSDGGPDVTILTDEKTEHPLKGKLDVIGLRTSNERIDPQTILEALSKRGMTKILVEGGSRTLSNFIDQGCIDRLHLIVAPMLIGSGYSSLNFSAISSLAEAMQPDVSYYDLGHDMLFDCDLSKRKMSA